MCSFFSAFVCTYWRSKMRNPTCLCWVLSLKRRSQLYFNLYLMFAKWQHILTKPNQNRLTHICTCTYIHWKSTHNNKRGSSKCVGIVSVLLFVWFYSYFFVSYFFEPCSCAQTQYARVSGNRHTQIVLRAKAFKAMALGGSMLMLLLTILCVFKFTFPNFTVQTSLTHTHNSPTDWTCVCDKCSIFYSISKFSLYVTFILSWCYYCWWW